MFIHEVFGDEVPDIFNEEINTTIQKFFENNLNISETARQLICAPEYISVPSGTFREGDRT